MDRTDFIPRLESRNAPVFLRPRRFGKSLLVPTLACYYDRTKVDRFEELFDGTWIGGYPTEKHSRHMIACYGFSVMVMASDMRRLERSFSLLNCSPVEIMVIHNRDLFQDPRLTTEDNTSQMLEEVLGYTHEHGLPRVYILTNEYDNFTGQLLTAYRDSLYEQVTTKDSSLRTFFEAIEKQRATIWRSRPIQ